MLVFGWDKVSARFHFLATSMVALGSIFSAIWIIVANSWQQTPAGHRIAQMTRDGQPWVLDGQPVMRAETADFWAVVFNPSTLDRLSHSLIGAFILGSFFIMSISAWYLLHGRHEDFARRSFSGALIFATVFSLAQLVSGDLNGRMVARHQPGKLAAFEGHFRTGPADLTLFGVPDAEAGTVRMAPAIPGGLSFLVNHDFQSSVTGLDRIPRSDWPPVGISYLSFHVMVGLGMLFIGLTVVASWLRLRGRLFEKRRLLWVFVFAVLGPFAANELGWVAAEVGRQPWIVHPAPIVDAAGNFALNAAGMVRFREAEGLRTAAAVSEAITPGQVAGAIAGYSLIYSLLLAVWLLVLNHKIQAGPLPVSMPARTTADGLTGSTAARTVHDDSMSEAKRDEDARS